MVDTLIVIPNQNLFKIANEKTTFADAFKMADDVLHMGVRGVTDLMVMPGLINLDFADIRTVMGEMGKAMMGTGEAEGQDRSRVAAESAISNPLLEDHSMKGAKGVLINITGGLDMTLHEVDEAANRIREEVDADANIIFGSTFDATMQGRMRVSVVSTGISAMAAQQPAAELPVARHEPADADRPAGAQPCGSRRRSAASPCRRPLPHAPPRRGSADRARRRRAAGDGAGGCQPAHGSAAADRDRRRWHRRSPVMAEMPIPAQIVATRRSSARAPHRRRRRRPAPVAPAAPAAPPIAATAAPAPVAPAAPRRARWSTRTTGASAVRRPSRPVRASEPLARPVAARAASESRAPNLFQRITGAFAAPKPAAAPAAEPVRASGVRRRKMSWPWPPSRAAAGSGAGLDQSRRHRAGQAGAR